MIMPDTKISGRLAMRQERLSRTEKESWIGMLFRMCQMCISLLKCFLCQEIFRTSRYLVFLLPYTLCKMVQVIIFVKHMQLNRTYGRGKEMKKPIQQRQSETIVMEKQLLGELLYPLVEKLEVSVLEFDPYVTFHILFVILINTRSICSDLTYYSFAASTCQQNHRDASGNGQVGIASFAEITTRIGC